MVYKAAVVLAAAVVVVVSLVAGKSSGPAPRSRNLVDRNVSQGGGGGEYTDAKAADAMIAVGAALGDPIGPNQSSFRGGFSSRKGEGVPVDVPDIGKVKHIENETASVNVSDLGETKPIDFAKYKKPFSIDTIAAEFLPSATEREGSTTGAHAGKYEKHSSFNFDASEGIPKYKGPTLALSPTDKKNSITDVGSAELIPGSMGRGTTPTLGLKDERKSRINVIGAEVIPGAKSKETTPILGPKDEIKSRSNVVGAEVLPSAKGKETSPILGPKNERKSRTDVVGAEVLPGAKGKETTPILGSKDERKSRTDVVGAEVLPGAKGKETTPFLGSKDERKSRTRVVGAEVLPGAKGKETTPFLGSKDERKSITDIVGAEVIPDNTFERVRNTSSHTPKDSTPSRLDVLGSKVIPVGTSENNRTTSGKTPKPSKVIPVKAPQPVKAPPIKGPKPQRVTGVTVPKPPQVPSVKTTMLTPGRVPKNKATAFKGHLGPCKEGLGKGLCSFQFHLGGRRHLMTRKTLQNYLETDWVAVTVPTKETMPVCCDGKTMMIRFVGRNRKGGVGDIAKANIEEMMNKEISKLKRKLGEMQKNDENSNSKTN